MSTEGTVLCSVVSLEGRHISQLHFRKTFRSCNVTNVAVTVHNLIAHLRFFCNYPVFREESTVEDQWILEDGPDLTEMEKELKTTLVNLLRSF